MTDTDFECDKCGTCCKWVFYDAPNNPLKRDFYVNRGAKLFGKLMAIPWRCPFLLANNECQIYDARPAICKDFNCKLFSCGTQLKILKGSED